MKNQYVRYDARMFQPGWRAPVRIAVGALGLSALYTATKVERRWRLPLVGFGAASLVRAISNRYVTDLIGLIANPVIVIRREIMVHAPAEIVFGFLRDFSNYSRFMSYIKKAEVNERGLLEWSLQGPAGVNVEWQATVGPLLENQMIGWQSVPGAPIHTAGIFRLTETRDLRTLLAVELSYAPPAGVFGGMISHLLGFDPREKIDDDLKVMKSLIERAAPNYVEMLGGVVE